jgi:membrane protease subunit HflC
MKKTILILVLVGVFLIIVSLLGPYFILTEGEQAVVVQFGKIVRVDTEAGLKYKVPFVENVVKFSKKVQSWDGDAQRIPTSENQFIWVDTTARWRISDPKKFYESVGSLSQAQGRLDDVIDSEVRKVISKNPLREAVRDSNIISSIKRSNVLASVAGSAESSAALSNISTLAEIQYENISTGRRALSLQMRDEARIIMPQYGMELIDVIIRQIKYSDDLTQSVYDRMIKERNQIAGFPIGRRRGKGEMARPDHP